MKAIMPNLAKDKHRPLYLQLYEYLKSGILEGEFKSHEKLPSIRRLADDLRVSVTTVNMAYQQLLVEGYINSKPQAGYFVNPINPLPSDLDSVSSDLDSKERSESHLNYTSTGTGVNMQVEKIMERESGELFFDNKAFDFVKWKKCMNKILNEHSHLLLNDGNPQGEEALRFEIARYLYQSRGVITKTENIVIGAGMQQITGRLSTLLSLDNVKNLVVETPGYSPVHNIFMEYGLNMIPIAVEADGIAFEKIPQDMRCAIYTSPSNQFPTGAVMPVGRRYEILELAKKNGSYIIEDDYDSELRYFGKPIPPLQSLDKNDCVVYLGSFSSTLFPSIKISYMVLPEKLATLYKQRSHQYTQTCSKTEQLTLAYYMARGFYQTNIKKLRRLYAQKLQTTINTFKKYGGDFVNLLHSSSGINMLIQVKTQKSLAELMEIAGKSGIHIESVSFDSGNSTSYPTVVLHFHQVPLNELPNSIKKLIEGWRNSLKSE